MNEQEAWLTLNAIPGVGNATIRDLVQYYGSAGKVFSLTKSQLLACGLAEALAAKIFEFDRDKFLKNEYNLIKKNGVRVLTLEDGEYPPLLKEIPDAPAVLYIKGSLALLKNLIGFFYIFRVSQRSAGHEHAEIIKFPLDAGKQMERCSLQRRFIAGNIFWALDSLRAISLGHR